ncbi:MAG: signal peptidase I [Clostridia bacterium]|nr:signal peptidase I [Clostridia bacterium]
MKKDRRLQDSDLYEKCFALKEQGSTYRFFAIFLSVVLALFIFRFYWTNNYGGVLVDGASMCNTLQHGDKLLMRYCDGEDAERGDVIVVYVENIPEIKAENEKKEEGKKTKYLIKRLIAVEGDAVKCTKGQIEIKYAGTDKWVKLYEPYAYYENADVYSFGVYEVGKGEVFFLGDNRNESKDSRYNQTQGSHLDRLYKVTDIIGIVPEWAIEHREFIGKYLIHEELS